MNRIIKSEFYKYRINGYYIVAFLFSIVCNLFTYFGKNVGASASVNGATASTISSTPVTFQSAMTGASGNLWLLLAFVIAFIVCNDYKHNTLKNVISSGNSRSQIYFGRLVSTVVAVVIIEVINLVVTFAFSAIMYGFGNNIDVVTLLISILIQFLATILNAILFYGLSSLIKGNIVSIVANIVFFLGNSLALYGLSQLFKQDWINNLSPTNVANFTTSVSSDVIVPIISAIVFGFIFCFAGYKVFQKKSV